MIAASSTTTAHAGSDPLTPEILAMITSTSTVTHEDDNDCDGNVEWHVVLDGQSVAVFGDEGEADNEAAAMQMRCAIEERVPKLASRTALVQGIRDLADLLEAHPEIPDPRVWACVFAYSGGNDGFRGACEALIPLGATAAIDPSYPTIVRLMHTLGPVTLEIDAAHSKVCESVTEVREVTEHRLPAWAQTPGA